MNILNTKIILATTICISSLATKAQTIEYSKRKNNYTVNDTVIAKLDIKGNGFGRCRSFFVKDLNEKKLIEYNNIAEKDTFGGFHGWYNVSIPEFNLQFNMDENQDLNSEKFFANVPIAFKLMNVDGKLNKDACKKFAAQNSFSNEKAFHRLNDSLKALVSGDRPIVARNRKYPPYADANGRIGQGDDVIGKWELKVIPNSVPGSSMAPIRIIYIKNTAGTLLAIYYKGTTDYTMFGKKKETVSLNPGATKVFSGNESDILLIGKIAEDLVYRGIL